VLDIVTHSIVHRNKEIIIAIVADTAEEMLKNRTLHRVIDTNKVTTAIFPTPQRIVLPTAIMSRHDYPITTLGAFYMLLGIIAYQRITRTLRIGTYKAYGVYYSLSKCNIVCTHDTLNLLVALLWE
jgi:hypothetical protein